MPERITKVQRWLDLIAHLVGRRYPVAVGELMERIPAYARKWRAGDDTARRTVRRMFERDKDELRDLGIPIETVSYTIQYGERVDGYRITRRDFYLPYLELVRRASSEGDRPPGAEPARPERLEIEPDDAGTALDALREAADWPAFPLAGPARSAFRKLAFDLEPERLAGESPVLFVDPPGAERVAASLRVLSDALLARKRVRFRYHGMYRGEETERDVAAYGLLFQHGHWYMIGHDATRDDLRVFRVGRMEAPEPNDSSPKTPDYEVPGDFRLDDYLDRDAWELGDEDDEPVRAEVLFRFPASLWAERNGHGELLEERPDGSALRAFDVHQADPFLRWILSRAGDAELLGPPELQAGLRGLARDVAAVYAADEDADADADAAGEADGD